MKLALFTNEIDKDGNDKEIICPTYERQTIYLGRINNQIVNTNRIDFPLHSGKTIYVSSIGVYDNDGNILRIGKTDKIRMREDERISFDIGYICFEKLETYGRS